MAAHYGFALLGLDALTESKGAVLVAAGVIEPGAVADTISRLRGSEAKLQGFLDGIMMNLAEMPFRPQTVRDTLSVVDGHSDR